MILLLERCDAAHSKTQGCAAAMYCYRSPIAYTPVKSIRRNVQPMVSGSEVQLRLSGGHSGREYALLDKYGPDACGPWMKCEFSELLRGLIGLR